ncbi:MAG TPA: LytTR family DNA-binding domain-containing protein [Cyclobacteriaceae bacterium]|nr:LytTR family DNA-binding domain-containing protein [Cyclobacteriaceae bacterium]HRJ80494.1 LytTR family DNA-binding domain-containing protein [Cyclobacteriaceae bacterium]
MKVLLAEDEPLAAERLIGLLKECDPAIEVTEQVDSVEELVRFFKAQNSIDLLLLDIQLADGKSFEVFDKVQIDKPIIFTTAYDHYAIQAFKHYSVDYLLKPVKKNELQFALEKFKKLTPKFIQSEELALLREVLKKSSGTFKERFLLKSGNKLQFKQASEVAYFYADGKAAFLITKSENRKYLIDHTLEELESLLDPVRFFRISRKFIVCIDAINEVKGLISSRLEIKINQPCEHELFVSRERTASFKTWLDR